MGKLEGKVAVITGAASGMGKAIAVLYAREGAQVVVGDIAAQAIEEVAAQIRQDGGQATATVANMAVLDDVNNLIDLAVSTYGRLDILVNNAGIMDQFRTAEDIDDELWARVMDINVTGPMRAIRRALPTFLAQGSGVIVNIASVAALGGSRGGIAYTSSKHALNGLTKNVAFVYAKDGVRSNAIAPGGVATNIGATINNPTQKGLDACMSGAGLQPRYGQSEEVADLALFLASDDSKFVNGVTIAADGGWMAY